MVFTFICVFALVSGIIALSVSLDDGGMRYDWQKEKWTFVPSRFDIMLDLICKSKCV